MEWKGINSQPIWGFWLQYLAKPDCLVGIHFLQYLHGPAPVCQPNAAHGEYSGRTRGLICVLALLASASDLDPSAYALRYVPMHYLHPEEEEARGVNVPARRKREGGIHPCGLSSWLLRHSDVDTILSPPTFHTTATFSQSISTERGSDMKAAGLQSRERRLGGKRRTTAERRINTK